MLCDQCLTRLPSTYERDGFRIVDPPGHLFFDGVRLHCWPAAARIMRRLLRFGAATFDQLITAAELSCKESVVQTVTRLRRALEQAGAPVRIVNEYGDGYRLEWSDQ